MVDDFSIAGRTILITGAAGYLGQAMTEAVLLAGGDVIAVGRSSDGLDGLVRTLEPALAERCHTIAADLTSPDAIAELVTKVEDRFDRLHGLVNNAYAGRVGPVDAIRAEDFADACAINLTAPFLLAQQLAAALRRGGEAVAGGASVVNVASMYGKVSPDPALYGTSGANNPAHYGATKAGLIQLTRYLACHLAPGLIRVNSISPGPFPNPAAGLPAELLEGLGRRVPIGRVGLTSDLAGPVIFLLSAAASYVNGADLAVDGGWTAW